MKYGTDAEVTPEVPVMKWPKMGLLLPAQLRPQPQLIVLHALAVCHRYGAGCGFGCGLRVPVPAAGCRLAGVGVGGGGAVGDGVTRSLSLLLCATVMVGTADVASHSRYDAARTGQLLPHSAPNFPRDVRQCR
eukprot:SAG25_NODE_1375_length_3172_cov_1.819069_2_plen_133_part_00